jgi:hypothetical protein
MGCMECGAILDTDKSLRQVNVQVSNRVQQGFRDFNQPSQIKEGAVLKCFRFMFAWGRPSEFNCRISVLAASLTLENSQFVS